MYKKILLTILITAVAALIVFTSRQSLPIGDSDAFAQKKSAVGVRIMTNDEHLPIAKWHETQNFLKKGSPLYTQVDGYDALRDGRTLYVNAINVICPQIKNSGFCLKSTPPAGADKCAYARECADSETGEPNFFTNVYVISLSDEEAEAQNIFDQILKNWHFNTNINVNNICAYASDIPVCKTAIGGEKGIAELQTELRRDARRISDVVFMQSILEGYYNSPQGHYPTLKAGTYLESQTISKWPSWQETLGAELRITMPKDPLNIFGICGNDNPDCYCEGYDANTCWDNKSRLFNGVRDVESGMPKDALVYYYKSYSNGASYEFNASRWETPYIGGEYVARMQAAHSASNMKPIIANIQAIKMSPNTEKTVEIQAYDYNKFTGKITWAPLELVGLNCITIAVLEPNTQNADKLYGDKFISYKNLKIIAGANICNGKIKLKVFDDGISNVANSAMQSDVYTVNVAVNNQLPTYPSGIETYSAETVVGFNWGYLVRATDAEDKNLIYKILYKPTWLSFEGGGEEKNSLDGVKILGIPNIAGIYKFSIEAKDSKGGNVVLAITLTVTNRAPVITASPANEEKHINENFSYEVKASDTDGHTITYSMTCTPPEINCGTLLTIDNATGKIISPDNFTISDYGEHNFTIVADDGYGGVASKNFTLRITPFCGNNVVENWVAGGIMEQCETGGNGTSVNDQYSCTSCQWSGGWRGDGISNGDEICDKNGPAKACAATYTEGLPAHCEGIPLVGTQSCNDSCTGWNECEVTKPTKVGGTSTLCGSTNANLTDDGGYACCELVSCSQDGCACCGRGVAAIPPDGYIDTSPISTKNAIWDPAQSLDLDYLNPDGSNMFLACGEFVDAGNSPTNACRLSKSDSNGRFWKVTTKHSTAQYRCWR